MWDVLKAACAKGCWWVAHFWDFVRFCGSLFRVVWYVLKAACAKDCLAWWLAHFWECRFCGILPVKVVCDFVRVK